MSIIGYFESGINRFLKLDKYTAKNKKEIKELIIQFEKSLANDELGEDKLKIKLLQDCIYKIKRSL